MTMPPAGIFCFRVVNKKKKKKKTLREICGFLVILVRSAYVRTECEAPVSLTLFLETAQRDVILWLPVQRIQLCVQKSAHAHNGRWFSPFKLHAMSQWRKRFWEWRAVSDASSEKPLCCSTVWLLLSTQQQFPRVSFPGVLHRFKCQRKIQDTSGFYSVSNFRRFLLLWQFEKIEWILFVSERQLLHCLPLQLSLCFATIEGVSTWRQLPWKAAIFTIRGGL